MTPNLRCPAPTSDTGAYRITWTGAEGAVVRVVENGELLYEGTQGATTVSGRSAGEYVYRIGTLEGGSIFWSAPCTITVTPPALGLAFFLFGVGFTVFASLLIVLVRGHRAHRRGELHGQAPPTAS